MPGISVTKIPIPFRSAGGISWASYWATRSLFFLDGSIKTVGENKYFTDKSINGRDFLITGYDFNNDWTVGFPYKSAATISAPAGDAALIAADINNFLYDAGGTPNQISVVSLFQDIDYEHKIFCLHSPQTFRDNGTELFEPRVLSIYMATDVLAGADLTTAQTYFGVPTENTTTMVWLAADGNDTTGNGSKATPYRTLDKIKATTATVAYLRTGDYTPAAQVTFANTDLEIIGTGRTTIGCAAVAIPYIVNKNLTFTHCDIDGTAATSNTFYPSKDLIFDKCRLTKTAGTSFTTPAATATVLTLSNCVINLNVNSGLITGANDYTELNINTCYGSLITNPNASYPIAVHDIKHNKFIAGKLVFKVLTSFNFSDNDFTSTANVTALDVRAANDTNCTTATVRYNKFTSSNNSQYNIYIGAALESGYNAINGLVFTHNSIINTGSGVGTHNIFIGGGIDNTIKYNYESVSAGYGMVIKSHGVHYTTTNAHISYNVLNFTGTSVQAIHGRGVFGLIVANNTILGYRGTNNIFHIDDDGGGLDNSMLCENNIISLGANTTNYYAGTNMTVTNNSINKNGFTLTQAIHANDNEITTSINADGVPASRINGGVTISGDNNIGLASGYSIPDAITYKTQDAEWQRGAVLV